MLRVPAAITATALAATVAAQQPPAQFSLSRAQTLQSFSIPAIGANPEDVAIADFDNDGDLDVAFAGAVCSAYLNGASSTGGSPSYGDFTPYFGGPFWLGGGQAVAVLDIEGDGDVDIVLGVSGAALGGNPEILIVRNDLVPSGTFGFSAGGSITLSPPQMESPSDLEVADFNGDGRPDILVTGDARIAGSGTEFVLLNTSTGGVASFAAFPIPGTAGTDTRAAAVGDIDGDGDIDAYLAEGNSGGGGGTPDNVLLNGFPGPLMIVAAQGFPLPFVTTDVQLVDMDGNATLDAVVTRNGAADAILFNNGAPPFGGAGGFLLLGGPGTQSESVTVADFDFDGDLDVVIADSVGGPPQFFVNNGAIPPAFVNASAARIDQNFGANGRALVVGDIDRDADPDLLLANTAGEVEFLINLDYQFDAPRVNVGQCPAPVTIAPTRIYRDVGYGPTALPMGDMAFSLSTIVAVEPRITLPGVSGLVGINTNNPILTPYIQPAIPIGTPPAGFVLQYSVAISNPPFCGFDLFHQAVYIPSVGQPIVSNVVRTNIQ